MSSFSFPDLITIYRPVGQAAGGVKGYGGLSRDKQEKVILADIPANVQARNSGRSNPTGLPGDTPMAQWNIYTPRGSLGPGVVKNHDVVVDQLGRRFGVTSDYNPRLGGNLICDRLEA